MASRLLGHIPATVSESLCWSDICRSSYRVNHGNDMDVARCKKYRTQPLAMDCCHFGVRLFLSAIVFVILKALPVTVTATYGFFAGNEVYGESARQKGYLFGDEGKWLVEG